MYDPTDDIHTMNKLSADMRPQACRSATRAFMSNVNKRVDPKYMKCICVPTVVGGNINDVLHGAPGT